MTDHPRDQMNDPPAERLPASNGDQAPGNALELLAPFDGSRGAEQVLRRACRTARRDGAGLAVLCLVRLPSDDETLWDDPGLDDTALAALVRAQVICREEGVVAVFKLNHARDLATAIVAEARRSGAVLICMSLDEYDEARRGETALMSETVQAVLASAPCSLVLDASRPISVTTL
ncbi:MAG: universal stress protein [Chloroflexota bacterium]